MSNDARKTEFQARHETLSERLTFLADDPELDEGQRELARDWRDRLEAVRERVWASLSVAFIAQVGRAGALGLLRVSALR